MYCHYKDFTSHFAGDQIFTHTFRKNKYTCIALVFGDNECFITAYIAKDA